MNRKITVPFILLCFLWSLGFAQNSQHKEFIRKHTNTVALKAFAEKQEKEFKADRAKALRLAKENGWLIRTRTDRGQLIELIGVQDGQPVYYITHNADAAQTINADKVYDGGEAGLSLSGEGIIAAVWDGGGVRASHQEFGGRVLQMDGATSTADHATHVAGTVGASGEVSDAKGMAPQATIHAYDWYSDENEIALAAEDGLMLSNHSYGITAGWTWTGSDYQWNGNPSISTEEDYKFGFYSGSSMQWDELAYDAPYHLALVSAGNDRGEGPGNGDYPDDGGANGYDCIAGKALSKNVMAVGSVNDLNNYSEPSDFVSSSFSSWGPVDDGRIKPDICGNGYNVYSTLSSADDAYGASSGTSMSSPNVTGGMALLHEHWLALNDNPMKAATMKALVIHTAFEAGPDPGPDYMFGWGVMNTETAAEAISNNLVSSYIREESLAQGENFSFDVYANGDQPLEVTIVWDDPAGSPVSPELDPSDIMLVNDLDLRITNGTDTYYPWRLDPNAPAAAASKGDNEVDNVEQVIAEVPEAGVYTIEISHKASLSNGPQDFSMIVTGITAKAPGSFTAEAVSNTQVDLSWVRNTDNDQVMLAYSEDNTFGMPQDGNTYAAGDEISGGGTVLYNGPNTGFQHENLASGKTYYYQAWSVNSDEEYSTASKADATTFYDIVFADDFQYDNGWTLSGEFERAAPQGLGGDAGNPDPDEAYIASKVLGTDLTGLGDYPGDYEYGLQNREYAAVSPVIDLTNFSETQIRFQRWLNIEDPFEEDSAFIDISTDGGSTWTNIWKNQEEITDDSWSEMVLDISDKADYQSQVQFRFAIGPTGYGQFFSGWNIDNFVVEGITPKYAVTFSVDDGAAPLQDAYIIFNGEEKFTGADGNVVFNNVPEGNALGYTVRKAGYDNYSGTVDVTSSDLTEAVTMTAGTATYKVLFTVDNGLRPVEGAEIAFNSGTLTTNAYGQAEFAGVSAGEDLPYTITQGNKVQEGTISVTNQNLEVPVTLVYFVDFYLQSSSGPVAGATVSLSGYGQQTSDSDGFIRFVGVLPDEDIPYTVSASGYLNEQGTIALTNEDVETYLTLTTANDLSFEVLYDADPVPGAEILVGGTTLYTDSAGRATISLSNGTYNYTISADGFYAYTGEVTLQDAPAQVQALLDAILYEATFNVSSGGFPLQGAEIYIDGQTLATNASGRATISLPNGDYPYAVNLAGYSEFLDTLTVYNNEPVKNITLQTATYLLTFDVSDGVDAVEGAAIDINGQGLATDNAGLASIELTDGSYDYSVEKDGFQQVSASVTISGSNFTESVVLNPYYTVTFTVLDSNGNPVEGASIMVDGQEYTTDSNGELVLDLLAGDYDYEISAEGYQTSTGTVSMPDDNTVELTLLTTALEEATGSSLRVYPNPTHGKLFIALPHGQGQVELTMVNLLGKVMLKHQTYRNSFPIDLSEQKTGVYLIKIERGARTFIQKIILK